MIHIKSRQLSICDSLYLTSQSFLLVKIKQHLHAQVKPVPASAGTVRSITLERDWFSLRHYPMAGSPVQGQRSLPPCSALGQSQCLFLLLVWLQQERAFPSSTRTVSSTAWEVSFSCILPSQLYDEKVLPHLRDTGRSLSQNCTGRSEEQQGRNGLCSCEPHPQWLQEHLVTHCFC